MRISHVSCLALIALANFVAATVAPADASVLVTIDKSTQRMTVEVDNHLRWIWPVSTGQPGHDTPNGRYTAFRMEADHFSKEWDDAPMPHSIFFSPTGHAIHGYLNTRRIGSPASHGCVRLEPANAAKLYDLVEQQGLPNTKVVVTGDVRLALARRGMPWSYGADESSASGAPDGRSYAYWRRVDIGQSAFGYRPGSPRYPPAQSGYGYGYSWRLHRY
jgi:L,D-transpeptidase catalytic domain